MLRGWLSWAIFYDDMEGGMSDGFHRRGLVFALGR